MGDPVARVEDGVYSLVQVRGVFRLGQPAEYGQYELELLAKEKSRRVYIKHIVDRFQVYAHGSCQRRLQRLEPGPVGHRRETRCKYTLHKVREQRLRT